MRSDGDYEHRAEHDPDRGARKRAEDRPSGPERVRTKHGQCAEHDPEPVLETSPLCDVDGPRQPCRSAEAVLEPDRVEAGVLTGQLLRGLERRTRRLSP